MMLYDNHTSISKEIITEDLIKSAWSIVAPSWPLKNLIAVNPLSGWQDKPFAEALKEGQIYFQQKDLPAAMLEVNRQSIKWLQAFFDDGMATIPMPLREKGLLASLVELLPFDETVPNTAKAKAIFNLKYHPKKIIEQCLEICNIPKRQHLLFLRLMLTTLPGWSGHIKYRTEWADSVDLLKPNQVAPDEFLAMRLLLTYLIWPKAKELILWHEEANRNTQVEPLLKKIRSAENKYRNHLLNLLPAPKESIHHFPDAQLVFCIDVRSEPFRKALEEQGNYETYGFAGFFGLPISIHNHIKEEHHASCPVLLKPQFEVSESPAKNQEKVYQKQRFNIGIQSLYQSLKYTFTAPFSLVETLGPFSGIKMLLRNIFPGYYTQIKKSGSTVKDFLPQTEAIPLDQQMKLAENVLRTMGLTKNFAPLVVFCGHGSQTENNAYATALDCGACGGHHGAPNAILLANILNTTSIREALYLKNIKIPATTFFLGAEHNTTTDEMVMFDHALPTAYLPHIQQLKADLEKAQQQNSINRSKKMGEASGGINTVDHMVKRAKDWAQVRPEWGLSGNASFIVAPRDVTKHIDLEGRAFLHSYDWQQDPTGNYLTSILTAPMIVGHWINSQYLFSTMDNIAFGGGSKISKNITGKIGIMQGNASDLMQGLPLQSVYRTDQIAYHEMVRLTTIVYAPKEAILCIIEKQNILQQLFKNEWVTLVCMDPITNEKLILDKELQWKPHVIG